MAVTVREFGLSRKFGEARSGDADATLNFWAYGSTDTSEVEAAIYDFAPPKFRGMLLDSYTVTPMGRGDDWKAAFKYSTRRIPEGEYRWTFDTTGATVRTTQAYAYTDYAASGTPLDSKGAIQRNSDGRVEGVDVVIGQLNLSLRARIPVDFITMAYVQTMKTLTGKTNNAPFLGFATGELLFKGLQGEIIPATSTDLNFSFAASENVTDLQLGTITGIVKGGHDYVWMTYDDVEDAAAKALAASPRFAHVNRVYKQANFALMKVGVTA